MKRLTRGDRPLFTAGLLLLLAVAPALPAAAGTLTAGIDVWTTPDDGNTYVDFTSNPVPAGFFCSGSPAFAQQIPVKGSPIVTNPTGALKKTDTIVHRLTDATFDQTLTATTNIQVEALSLVQHAPITISCTGGSKTFNVTVNHDPNPPQGTQTVQPMTVSEDDSSGSGGTFNATVVVPALVTFTDTSTGAQTTPLSDVITLQVSGGAWAATPGTGGVVYNQPLLVDTTGSGTAGTQLPGTSNFNAGWSHLCSPACPIKIDHKGPHPTWPVPPSKGGGCINSGVRSVLRAVHRGAGQGTVIQGAAEDDGRADASPRLVAVRRYSGGTVAVLSHGFGATGEQAGAKPSIVICYDGGTRGEVTVIGTADGSPVIGER
ncbi:MAG TPA: hypothetical protein VMW75_22290 [Thermoanaerobaculia bacterium]|nr:hypothetical protein [Thermoanaerobaculia bacterium]